MRRLKMNLMISGVFLGVFLIVGGITTAFKDTPLVQNPMVQKIVAIVEPYVTTFKSSGKPHSAGANSAGLAFQLPVAKERSGRDVKYDRKLYSHWIDIDQDCQNARHELLQELSTGTITLNKSGCTVATGRWNDPYTGHIYTTARDLDIDHMVPLAWAHAHGAHSWNADTRRIFANDPVNLFAVQASANRQKGAKGPLDWLPPNKDFQCQYVTRFHRIVVLYGLTYSLSEGQAMATQRAQLCGSSG